eukprot:697833-Pyramimonas_sp.AAC.1
MQALQHAPWDAHRRPRWGPVRAPSNAAHAARCNGQCELGPPGMPHWGIAGTSLRAPDLIAQLPESQAGGGAYRNKQIIRPCAGPCRPNRNRTNP